jgi:hypothetical protein
MVKVVVMVWSKYGEGDLRGPKVLILSIYYHLAVILG